MGLGLLNALINCTSHICEVHWRMINAYISIKQAKLQAYYNTFSKKSTLKVKISDSSRHFVKNKNKWKVIWVRNRMLTFSNRIILSCNVFITGSLRKKQTQRYLILYHKFIVLQIENCPENRLKNFKKEAKLLT